MKKLSTLILAFAAAAFTAAIVPSVVQAADNKPPAAQPGNQPAPKDVKAPPKDNKGQPPAQAQKKQPPKGDAKKAPSKQPPKNGKEPPKPKK